jgi:hypothetical protein
MLTLTTTSMLVFLLSLEEELTPRHSIIRGPDLMIMHMQHMRPLKCLMVLMVKLSMELTDMSSTVHLKLELMKAEMELTSHTQSKDLVLMDMDMKLKLEDKEEISQMELESYK